MILKREPILVLFNIFLYLIMYYVFSPAKKYPYKICRPKKLIGIFILFLFVVYAFYDTDYFHYLTIFNDISQGYEFHLEPVYYSIVNLSHQNYSLFRFIIWGTALLLYLQTIHRFTKLSDLSLFFFTALFIPTFSYARVSLAMSLIFFGIGLITVPSPNHKTFSFFIGILFLCASFYFHRSSLFGILTALFALFVQMNKKRLFIFSFLYPISIIAVTYIISIIIGDIADFSSGLDFASAQNYLLKEESVHGMGRTIRDILIFSPYYISIYIYCTNVWNKTYNLWPYPIKIIGNIIFYIISFASIFIFNLNANTSIIFYRFLYFAMIPTSIFLAYCWYEKINVRMVKLACSMGTIGAIYNLVYFFYVSIVTNGAV